MKRLAFCILVLLTLTACAPAVPQTQTSEVPPTGTMSETSEVLLTSTPKPTERPPSTPIPRPTENPSRNALLGLGYTYAELKDYTISEGTFSFPGDTVIYNGLIGTKADGTKEILAFKFSDNPNLLKLTGTEFKEAGKRACSAGQCFSHGEFGPNRDPITDIYGETLGFAESIEKRDANGNVMIITKSELIATLSDGGFPRFFRSVVEMVDPANPNKDLLENIDLRLLGLVNNSSTTVHSIEELNRLIPKGMRIFLGVRHQIPPTNDKAYSLFKATYDADPVYLSALGSFLKSNGTQTTTDPILVLSSFTEWR